MTDGLGLGDAYDATSGRIKGQGGGKARLGMATLMWVSYAERPLKVDELCYALAVEIRSSNLNSDSVPSIRTLLACCQGLVAVDREASVVRLIHFTFQEYLRVRPELFGRAHAAMSETCLSYLNSPQVKALSASPSPDLQETPFLEYSSLYWGMHARRVLSGPAKLLALRLFEDYNHHISIKILLKSQRLYSHLVSFDKPSLFTGLHCTSVFGVVEMVASFVRVESYDINRKDCVGNTPLVWADLEGHEGVVEVLLGRDDVDPNKPDRYGQTPISCAAMNGHEGVVRTLLEQDDVDPNEPDSDNRTPLLWASSNGHGEVAKILLERSDISPDKPDILGRGPLQWAALNKHKELAKMLRDRGKVNPDKPDGSSPAPLWRAAQPYNPGAVAQPQFRGPPMWLAFFQLWILFPYLLFLYFSGISFFLFLSL